MTSSVVAFSNLPQVHHPNITNLMHLRTTPNPLQTNPQAGILCIIPPIAMSFSSGTKLGPYVILAPLGSGGMGEVYHAKDTRLDRSVAIKVLPPHTATSPEARQRFEREARA